MAFGIPTPIISFRNDRLTHGGYATHAKLKMEMLYDGQEVRYYQELEKYRAEIEKKQLYINERREQFVAAVSLALRDNKIPPTEDQYGLKSLEASLAAIVPPTMPTLPVFSIHVPFSITGLGTLYPLCG